MAKSLSHSDVQRVMASFAESNIINLDLPLRALFEAVKAGLPSGDEKVSIHVLCCNEYAVVTGLAANSLEEVRSEAALVRETLE